MVKRINACHIYLFVIWLCTFNGSLYPPSGFIAQGLQYVLILMSLYYALYAHLHYSLPLYFKGLDVLLLMFSFYGVVLLMEGERLIIQERYLELGNTMYLKSIYKSLLPVYPFFVFTKQGLLKEKTVKFCFFIFLALTIYSYYRTETRLLKAVLDDDSSIQRGTNNTGYTFVSLLPALVLFYKKPILQYLGIIVCTFFIVSAIKRGAILCGVVCVGWFMTTNLKAVPKKKRWIVAFLSAAVVLFGIYLSEYLMENSAHFQYRLDQTEEGDSHGRDQLYHMYYYHFITEENPLRFLFGNGANATLKIGFNFAHNDWLEIAINHGLLGLIIFLSYWVCFYISWRRTRRNPQAFMAIGMIFIIYLLTTLFSMSYNSVTRCAAMVLGYYLAGMNNKVRYDKNQKRPKTLLGRRQKEE